MNRGVNTDLQQARASLIEAQSFTDAESDNAGHLNPLLTACGPLLYTASQLSTQSTTPDLTQLHQSLCQEVSLFENKARVLNYDPTAILAARYLLCALIDEVIITTTWAQESDWQQHNLLKKFQHETMSGKRFFLIIERCCEDPKSHIDLLELAYLCLSLGYEGQYRHQAQGPQELDQITEKLYELIREQRGELSKRLFVAPPTQTVTQKARLQKTARWKVIAVTVVALMVIYVPYHIRLSQLATPVFKSLQNMIPKADNPTRDHHD